MHEVEVLTIQIAQASETTSNRKCLLKVAQIVWYLARPGWLLQVHGNEIDNNFAKLLLLHGNYAWFKDIEQIQQHKISMYIPDPPIQ